MTTIRATPFYADTGGIEAVLVVEVPRAWAMQDVLVSLESEAIPGERHDEYGDSVALATIDDYHRLAAILPRVLVIPAPVEAS